MGLFESLSNWGRWGPSDETGALNFIDPDMIRSAAASIRLGRTVSLSRPFATRAGVDNPKPAVHSITQLADRPGERVQWNADFVGADYHGKAITHVDALAHCVFEGRTYNGVPSADSGPVGARRNGISAAANGVVGRGVLLDIPRFRNVQWLEPGTAVGPEELALVEERQGVRVGIGDVLLVRTGHETRAQAIGAWDSGSADAGLSVEAASWIHERSVSVIGSDGDNDASPSTVEGIHLPVHVLALAAMGVLVLDNLRLDELASMCASAAQWDFMVIVAPLRVEGGTGSPVNPIAVL